MRPELLETDAAVIDWLETSSDFRAESPSISDFRAESPSISLCVRTSNSNHLAYISESDQGDWQAALARSRNTLCWPPRTRAPSIYTYIYIYMYICYTLYLSLSLYIYIYIHDIYVHMYMCVYIYIYIYICMYTNIYIYIYMYVCMYVYIYIYIYSFYMRFEGEVAEQPFRPVSRCRPAHRLTAGAAQPSDSSANRSVCRLDGKPERLEGSLTRPAGRWVFPVGAPARRLAGDWPAGQSASQASQAEPAKG